MIYDETEFGSLSDEDQVNVSPVNFFTPDLDKFPHFKRAIKEIVYINSGDCLFIPAFYFY